jgi:hypothetical protein
MGRLLQLFHQHEGLGPPSHHLVRIVRDHVADIPDVVALSGRSLAISPSSTTTDLWSQIYRQISKSRLDETDNGRSVLCSLSTLIPYRRGSFTDEYGST